MGDMREVFDDMREHSRRRRKRNMKVANPEGWIVHTQWHWSRTLNGHRLDYWPSKNKWSYKGKIEQGDIIGFIKRRDPDFVIPPTIDAKTNEDIWNDMGYKKLGPSQQKQMFGSTSTPKEFEKEYMCNPLPENPEQSLATAPINVYNGSTPPWEDD